MYSAAISHSSIVDPAPRLSRIGFPLRLAARSRVKFCMLRAPIWSMSAKWPTTATSSQLSTSVTTGSPVRARASAR